MIYAFQFISPALRRHLILATFLLAVISQLPAQLNGTYTIGGWKPDYNSIGAAVAHLNASGVTGAVTFLIRPGVYEEQITLSSVNGASKYNTITFTSESGKAADVVIRYHPTYSSGYYVLRFSGGRYYRILNLTVESTNNYYTGVVQAYGQELYDILIRGCRLLAPQRDLNDRNLSVIVIGAPSSKLRLHDNYIRGGTGGMSINNGISTEITDNFIYHFGYQAVFLGGLEGGKFTGNRIIGSSRSTSPSKGVIIVQWNGTALKPVLLANNFISLPSSSHDAFIVSYSQHVNVYYNSVNFMGRGWGFVLRNNQFADVKNNIFKSGSTYAIDVDDCTDCEMNYNDIYTSSGPLGTYYGRIASDLQQWRLLSGQDARSISVDPWFVSSKDLHATSIALCRAGVLVPGVKVDIDGDLRAKPPCIGADEFTKGLLIPYYSKSALSDDTQSYEEVDSAMSVFPNPVAKELNVMINDTYEGLVSLTVLDGLGRNVFHTDYQKKGAELRTNVGVEHLSPGVYQVRIEEGRKTSVKRFVKR